MRHQRREFLKLMGVGGAFTLLPLDLARAATPAAQDRATYISASAGDHDDYYVSAFNAAGKILFEQPLPWSRP